MMKQGHKEIDINREIDAPPRRVFRAWVDPQQVAQWWGPNGFTNPVVELDVRPGGPIRIDMRAPDGTVSTMGGEYGEVIENERIEFTSTAFPDENGDPQLEARSTVSFEDRDGKTVLVWYEAVTRSTPAVAAALEGMEEGTRQTLDRLARFIEKS